MSSVLVLGATGLCGAAMVQAASKNDSISKVLALTRRALPAALSTLPKTENIVNEHTDRWTQEFPKADIVFSSLSTTRAAAGSLAAQYKIDHDLNVELAKAAKAKGATTFILVSSNGANSNSMLPYLRLKGDCERDILALNFEKTVILRPGILLGERDGSFKGAGNGIAVSMGNLVYDNMFSFIAGHPAHASDVALAGLDAALHSTGKVITLEGGKVVSTAKHAKSS